MANKTCILEITTCLIILMTSVTACGPGCTGPWPHFIGDGTEGVIEVETMDVDAAGTNMVLGVYSTDTRLSATEEHVVMKYTVSSMTEDWM